MVNSQKDSGTDRLTTNTNIYYSQIYSQFNNSFKDKQLDKKLKLT